MGQMHGAIESEIDQFLAAREAEDALDEAVAERADELCDAEMADADKVREHLDSVLADDYDSVVSSKVARFLTSYAAAKTDGERDAAGYHLHRELFPVVRARAYMDAETEAQAEAYGLRQRGEIARDEILRGNADLESLHGSLGRVA